MTEDIANDPDIACRFDVGRLGRGAAIDHPAAARQKTVLDNMATALQQDATGLRVRVDDAAPLHGKSFPATDDLDAIVMLTMPSDEFVNERFDDTCTRCVHLDAVGRPRYPASIDDGILGFQIEPALHAGLAGFDVGAADVRP